MIASGSMEGKSCARMITGNDKGNIWRKGGFYRSHGIGLRKAHILSTAHPMKLFSMHVKCSIYSSLPAIVAHSGIPLGVGRDVRFADG